jgi:hypothetical protein
MITGEFLIVKKGNKMTSPGERVQVAESEQTVLSRAVDAAKFIGHLVSGPHVLASHGDHLFSANVPAVQVEQS